MNNNPKGAKNPKKPLIFYYAVMLLVLMMLNWLLFPSLLQRQVTEVGYDEFISMVDKGQVETIAYDKQNQEITFEAKNDKGKDALYKTGIFPDDELVGRLLGANVKFAAEIPTQTSPLLSMLISYVVPIVLIIAVGQWLQKKMMKNMGGNMMSFGKSNAKIYAETETGKTFADVAGQDEAKEALTEIVDFLHNPNKYASIGADGGVLVRVVQEVHDLGEGLLGLILTGDIGKGLAGLGLGVNLGVGFAEAHHVAAHVLHHLFLQPLTDRDNEHNWHNVADEHAQQGRGLGRDLGGKLDIGPQQTADQLVIREDASLVECVLALVVLGLEGDLLVLLVISDGFDLTLVHHGDELVVADFGHLPLQQARKQQPVEHHKHEQHDSIIEDQRFFGIFRPFGVVIHVSFVLSSKSLRFRCIFCITLHRVCISCSEMPCCSVSAKVSQR